MRIAAIDPGRDKCGMAIVAGDGKVLDQAVVATVWLVEELMTRVRSYGPELLLIGNGTTSEKAQARIREALPELKITVVDEYRTTEDAKQVYWEAHPPKGWRRFFPTSMQVPPVPVDDFVAVIMAKRYLINQNYR
jgi:hypothetical protein